MRLPKKITIMFLCFPLAISFIFIHQYHLHHHHQDELRLKTYANFISFHLWNLNKEAITNYLTLLEETDLFHGFEVLDENNHVFLSILPKHHFQPTTVFYQKFKQFRDTHIQTDVYFNNQKIGVLKTTYTCNFLRVFIYVFIFTSLLTAFIFYYLKGIRLSRKLKNNEAKYRTIIENIRDIIVVTSTRGKLLYISASAEKFIGFKPEDLFHKKTHFIIHDQKKIMKQFLSQIKTQNNGMLDEYRIQTKSGETKWVLHTWQKIMNIDNPFKYSNHHQGIIISLIRDITDLKNAQIKQDKLKEQMIENAKLASLGTIAAGIAHELNNPLTIVSGYFQILSRSKELNIAPEKIIDYTKAIEVALNRMQTIIGHIKVFGKDTSNEPMALYSINKVINDSLILLNKQLLNHDIQVNLILDEKIPETFININKLETAFHNLIINSKDAFDAHADLKNKAISITTQCNEKEIIIKYKDNAGGISSANTRKIFDPFFTTKEVGKGTGLGLSITHGILKEHNGTIKVDSILGEGSEFTLTLPLNIPTQQGQTK